MWENLMSFLYAYTFSPVTVLQDHSRRRDAASGGLTAVAGRLDRAAEAMQKALDTKWWPEPTFADFLQQCTDNSQTISDTKMPDFALHLPSTLHRYSLALTELRKELQKHLGVRKVGKTFYLAEFATYIQAATQRPIPWNEIAELVNAARPENLKEQQVDPPLLKKNFNSFTRRNEKLYQEIRADIAQYLDTCQRLPPKERPTLVRWTLNRRPANK